MACADLLFLLLMSSSLLASGRSAPSSSDQPADHSLQKRNKGNDVLTAVEYINKIGTAASPFIGLIPVVGGYINYIVNIATVISAVAGPPTDPTMALIKTKFDKLDIKLDKYHAEVMWNTWAVEYFRFESDIRTAWKDFEALVEVCTDPKITAEKRANHVTLFRKQHKLVESATKKLVSALTTSQPSFTAGFVKLLTDHVNCHEKNIKENTALIYDLVFRGNTINHFYYRLNDVSKVDELAKLAFDSASAMFQIHKFCIQDCQQLAKDVRMFLQKMYDRYDWIVVAYVTKNSEREGKIKNVFNRHFLGEFTKVEVGEVTVAAARQVKGSHSMADEVRKAINSCFAKKSATCHKVIQELKDCQQKVGGLKLEETYSAVHAFTDKSHESSEAKDASEAPEDEYVDPENPSQLPYVYRGECQRHKLLKKGKFTVLIKSDEEMKKKPPCDKLDCGGPTKGKCVVVENTLIPVCECEKDRYGEKCEESVDDYKRILSEETPQI